MQRDLESPAGTANGADTFVFRPFYERLPDRFPIPFIAKLFVSILLGFIFLAPHYLAVEEKEIATDWSWLLSLIIVAAMLGLYYATDTFRQMFPQLNLRLPAADPTVPDNVYLKPIQRYLSDKLFLQFGFVFAVLNCFVGWGLGVPHTTLGPIASSYLGFLISGFVCGMAVCGIRGVVITLTRFLDQGQPKADYTNPDGCGGFLFLGEALIKFSAITLIVGIMISVYILKVSWIPSGIIPLTIFQSVMWLWIALPFALSLTILLAPASHANRVLINHKIQEEVQLALALDKAKEALKKAGTDRKQQETIRHEIEFYDELRSQLHKMRIWPLNTRANVKFISLFISNAYIAFESIRGLLAPSKSISSYILG